MGYKRRPGLPDGGTCCESCLQERERAGKTPGLPDGGARCERYLPPLPVPNSWLPFVWRSSGHELLFQQSVGSLESADLWLVLWAGLHIPRCTVWLLSFKKKKK